MSNLFDHSSMRADDWSTVFIASEDILARWTTRVASPTDLLVFADADAQHALDVIHERRPHVVVLEQMFANTSRGEALVKQIRLAPQLAGIEIRTLSAERSSSLGAGGLATGMVLANLAQPLTQMPGPIRRARRVRMSEGVRLLVHGAPATLIDLSTIGAQVVSPTILRPSQHVRVVLMDDDAAPLRAAASVAWSTLELSRDAATYRVGIAFEAAHPEFLSTLSPDVEP